MSRRTLLLFLAPALLLSAQLLAARAAHRRIPAPRDWRRQVVLDAVRPAPVLQPR